MVVANWDTEMRYTDTSQRLPWHTILGTWIHGRNASKVDGVPDALQSWWGRRPPSPEVMMVTFVYFSLLLTFHLPSKLKWNFSSPFFWNINLQLFAYICRYSCIVHSRIPCGRCWSRRIRPCVGLKWYCNSRIIGPWSIQIVLYCFVTVHNMLCWMFGQRCFFSVRSTAMFHKVSEASGRLEVQSRSLGSIPGQTKLNPSSVYHMNYFNCISVLIHIIFLLKHTVL